LTEEKRARLKSNPVKVHFAEEVLVSGHSQVRLKLEMAVLAEVGKLSSSVYLTTTLESSERM
jgi:hypothetical protein